MTIKKLLWVRYCKKSKYSRPLLINPQIFLLDSELNADKFFKQNIDFNAVNKREELHFGLFSIKIRQLSYVMMQYKTYEVYWLRLGYESKYYRRPLIIAALYYSPLKKCSAKIIAAAIFRSFTVSYETAQLYLKTFFDGLAQ